MKKNFLFLFSILFLMPILFFLPLISSQSIGISNCAELQNMINNVSADYHLTNNIDCSGINFIPISTFSGTFDGKGNNIINLYVNIYQTYNGLFRFNEGSIANVNMVNATILGNYNYFGAIVGSNQVSGIIENCSSTGKIIGHSELGGIAGENYGTIKNSYSHINISGSHNNGGLVGLIYAGSVTNSYSTGNISCFYTETCGGLVGVNDATVTSSYYDTQTSGQSDTGKGIPKTTIEMMNINTFSAWDIALIESWINEIWFINNTYDYPRLSLLLEEPEPECYINEDCEEGYICEDNICILEPPPTPISETLGKIGGIIIVIFIFFVIFKIIFSKIKGGFTIK